MESTMRAELNFRANDTTRQTNASFTTLAFGTLALSVQFSPPYGNEWPWLLVFSWVSLLISGLVGGRNLIERDTAFRINVQKIDIDASIHTDVCFLRQSHIEKASDETLFTTPMEDRVTKKEVLERLNYQKNQSMKVDTLLLKFDKNLIFWFHVQIASYLIGITLNGLFVAYNYLCKSSAL